MSSMLTVHCDACMERLCQEIIFKIDLLILNRFFKEFAHIFGLLRLV